jgi:transcriptional regulator with XRE-family HTH domain
VARKRTSAGGAQDPRRPTEQDRALGPRLKALRKAAGLTQEGLASALGVSYQQVQKYEKGTSRVSGGRLQQAAALLGVSLQELVGDLGVPGFAESGGPNYEAGGSDAAELVRHFGTIKDPEDREMLLRLAKRLAGR